MTICRTYLLTISHKNGEFIYTAYVAGPLTQAIQETYERIKVLSYTKPITGDREAHDIVIKIEGVE